MSAAAVLMLAWCAGAQTLDLGPVPKPPVNTGDALTVRFMAEMEASESERERAIVSLGAMLARSGDSAEELAARTIGRHLDALRTVMRDAERIAQDSEAEPIVRQRLREVLHRFDAEAARLDSGGLELAAASERIMGLVALLAQETTGEDMVQPRRLGVAEDAADLDPEELMARAAAMEMRLGESAMHLSRLVEVLDSVRAVPSLENAANRGLRAVGQVLDLCELNEDRFIVRAAFNRLARTVERCLIADGEPRAPAEAVLMLEALGRIGGLVERCADLEGDTARRIEPALGAMMDRLQTPLDAELIELVLVPLERSVDLIVRGAALPAPSGVSAQLRFAWRFLLPQEQDARVAAIEAVGAIVEDAERIASPAVVSALVGHAEMVEALEALMEVDELQDELENAGIPGAAQSLDALRADLRLMGDKDGYREARARVLPIVRAHLRYHRMPGTEAIESVEEGDPDWAVDLREFRTQRLGRLRIALSMQLISESQGGMGGSDAERLDARRTLETLRKAVLLGADLLMLDAAGREKLGALPEFEWFDGENAIGLPEAIGLDRVERTLAEAVDALMDDNAQRADALLRSIEGESTVVGVLAEMVRRSGGSAEDGATPALEAALVLRRLESLGSAAAPLAELSLVGRYREDGVDRGALRRYTIDQAERMIDEIGWLREAWQRRR